MRVIKSCRRGEQFHTRRPLERAPASLIDTCKSGKLETLAAGNCRQCADFGETGRIRPAVGSSGSGKTRRGIRAGSSAYVRAPATLAAAEQCLTVIGRRQSASASMQTSNWPFDPFAGTTDSGAQCRDIAGNPTAFDADEEIFLSAGRAGQPADTHYPPFDKNRSDIP